MCSHTKGHADVRLSKPPTTHMQTKIETDDSQMNVQRYTFITGL